MTEHRIIDLFCGTGGFANGFEQFDEKFRVVCAIDILKDALLTTKANHPDCLVIQDDIRNVGASAIGQKLGGADIDLIIAGPPCQGFSSLRPFRSLEDEDPRNNLFEQFASYVGYFRPKVFVMENVVGLLTFNQGSILEAIQQVFSQMDYSTEWKILNAANFGVPQKRERFILIGRRDGGPISFPSPTHAFNGRSIGYKDREKMVTEPANARQGDLFRHGKSKLRSLPPALTTMDAIGDLPPVERGQKVMSYGTASLNDYQASRRKNCEELTLHEATNHSDKMMEIIRHAGESISSIPKGLITSGFSSCYSRISPQEPSTTITVKFTSPSSSKCIHPFQDRSITPREAARIQGFDDDYIFCGSKTDIACQLGNAVPPLLGRAIAESVLPMLEETN